MRVPFLASSIILSVALITACGEDDPGASPTGNDGNGGSGNAPGTGGSGAINSTGGSGGSGPVCDPPGFTDDKTETAVGAISGTVQDTQGQGPGAKILVDIYGYDLCINAEELNQDTGAWSISGGQELQAPRLIYGAGKEFVKFSGPIPTLPDHDFGTFNFVRYPAFSEGKALTEGTDVTMGPVTLSLPSPMSISHDIILYTDESERVFRSLELDLDGLTLPSLDTSLNLEIAFAMSPINTQICPAAKMTIGNTPGWDPNAEVEFHYQGTKIFTDYAPYGAWTKVSEGKVSADGNTISTNDDEGIYELGVIGVRLK